MHQLATAVLFSVGMAGPNEAAEQRPGLCSLATVAVVGDKQAVKEVRKRVARDTWLKAVDSWTARGRSSLRGRRSGGTAL